MKLAILSLLAGAAAAFAPAQQGASTSALSASFENEVGVQVPTGFFDPLNLLEGADQARFDRLRYVELKHGRIAQLAFLGQIVTRNGIHLGGSIDTAGHAFSSYPNGLAALFGPDAIPTAGIFQMLAFIGFLELKVMKDVKGTGEFPGDFRNGFLDFGWGSQSDEWKKSKRSIELNNGRAAMMGILGLMVHEKLGSVVPIVGQL
eukprot:CAMPEP_0183290566 /NCGR_PEP_ID=MMETSP0160_2-20130417/192_1 /TAXON_ID=2839 ORGANISM="Odontella Sinensis, Strain Grunow 1884" /NCGR_SAMPLE_ID=MMETSP0160_2 /ASSEMBLY_ACC=CAM_ASM_000250 /LENGTH=203 /DNA_ID=CAMNT_0025451193 /DNA_START=37 /DNA_END=648 /DNA_ORIENTATION=+